MTSIILSVALVWGLGVVSPGPNFLLVSHSAVNGSRDTALWSVLGIALGTAMWGTAGFVGIGLLFAAAPWLYVSLKIVGGLYLMWRGVRMVMSARRLVPASGKPVDRSQSARSAVARGFLTIITNPKSAVFVASLFAAVMPANPTIGLGVSVVAAMVVISVLWYGAVGWSLSYAAPQRIYRRSRRRVEIVAGGLFILLGAKLALSR